MTITGGAFAIKGFNYQKAIISLIAILNYRKEGFEIFVENQEDVEVRLKDSHTFIQIKGSPLSIKSLTKVDKNNKSILGKNLRADNDKARYKIVTLDNFANADKVKLIDSGENLIFKNVYKYSDNQKENIIKKLKIEGFSEEDLKNKLSTSYLYFSPFKNNYLEASSFLMGEMVFCNIKTDDKRGIIAISELFRQIDQKSEILPTEDNPYNPKKKLTTNDLQPILVMAGYDFQKDIFDDVGEIFTLLEKKKIERLLLEITSTQRALKRKIQERIGYFEPNKETSTLIKELYGKVEDLSENKPLLYAIIINVIADKFQKELSC